jgi:hypothetical protein
MDPMVNKWKPALEWQVAKGMCLFGGLPPWLEFQVAPRYKETPKRQRLIAQTVFIRVYIINSRFCFGCIKTIFIITYSKSGQWVSIFLSNWFWTLKSVNWFPFSYWIRFRHIQTHGRQSWEGWGPPPQFLECGDEYLIISPPYFLTCLMKFCFLVI